MPASPAQIAANRANSLRSTGPRSPEGKATSSRNALTHGAHASDDTILAAASDTYLDAFHARFQPADAFEDHLVEHLAILASRRDRLNAAVEALLELDERHALTECLHERYGINEDNTYIPGQPSWQAAMRRYDGNTYLDPRHPEPVSDPALDPDPALCSLAYTLSSPRAAALFRHEAAVDRRFHAALKELTTIVALRQKSASSRPPAAPVYEPRLNHALNPHLRQTATAPAGSALDRDAPSAAMSPAAGAPAPAYPDPHASPPSIDPSVPDQAAAASVQPAPNLPNEPIEANAFASLTVEDQATTLLSVLSRLPARPAGLYGALLDELQPPLLKLKPQDEANPLRRVTNPPHSPDRVPSQAEMAAESAGYGPDCL